MAEVFKGRVVAAEGFEKLVAIKRILPDLAEDERFVKMLLTEARIHSALSHRNIVQIHDLGISEDGQYFIVLEFVDGYDLRMITEQLGAMGEIIPEVLSLHIASELAQALHFAHELRGDDGQPLGLIHRDVTPSNVLISLAGEVKLSDFGLAKRRHDRSVVGSLKGNLSYMSPEQAMQKPLDRRTDIFSLGAVLFELLTGRRLREITDEVAGWTHVASGAIPSARAVRPDIPPAIERLLDRALAPDPDQRFPDAAAFGVAIRQALNEMNIPVGASDLGALLGVVNPPRKLRNLVPERSKVIRLGPEARALREAIAAPATPAPIPNTPRVTPQPSSVEASRRTTPPSVRPSIPRRPRVWWRPRPARRRRSIRTPRLRRRRRCRRFALGPRRRDRPRTAGRGTRRLPLFRPRRRRHPRALPRASIRRRHLRALPRASIRRRRPSDRLPAAPRGGFCSPRATQAARGRSCGRGRSPPAPRTA